MSKARAAARHPDRHQPPRVQPDRVVIAWCHPGDTAGAFTDSVLGLMLRQQQRGEHTLMGHISLQSGPRVAEARSQIVDAFLGTPAFEAAQWLWMVDVDMVFEADTLDRLLTAAHPTQRPVVGGLCFAGGRSSRIFPTIYALTQDPETKAVGVEPVADYPEDALVKVGATGAACLLIHRNVFVQMTRPHPLGFGTFKDGRPNPYPWFVEGGTNADGRPYGEDVAFCVKCAALNIPIHVHTGIEIGHRKETILDAAAFRAAKQVAP